MLNGKPAMKLVMKGLLVSGAVLFGAALTDVGPFGNAYFFGDSLTDCCAFGRTTNGPNWSDLLPSQIGASYTATLQTKPRRRRRAVGQLERPTRRVLGDPDRLPVAGRPVHGRGHQR